jgi:MoxR-like ATPase
MSYRQFNGTDCDFYVTSKEVAETVNLAIALQRPILVEGEAGCGKTMLASAIAAELGLETPVSVTVKSTQQARDLLYRFDALRRLQEIQDPNNKRANLVYPYITLQPLGKVIHEGKPCVMLIDEIDKADIDFPNDLLEALDRFAFDIDDLPVQESARSLAAKGFGRRVTSPAGLRPIVVITSNREKQLPEPFLRRCLYLELNFPLEPELLAKIVKKNLDASVRQISNKLIDEAIKSFLEIRANSKGLQKPPATSELIDWVKVLHWEGGTLAKVRGGKLQPPYWRILFKTMQDLEAYTQRSQPPAEQD